MPIAMQSVPAVQINLGCGATGKTQSLIDRTIQLIGQGESPASIIVVCATPGAREVMQRRLFSSGVPACVRIATMRELALGILSAPRAVEFTGRQARMMLPYERSFLIEDLKTSGMKQKRLREMLKFFERNWTELAEDSDGWLLEGEETTVHGFVREHLDFYGGMLETEISAFAVRYLLSNENVLAGTACPHVLVDDFQLLSRASQVLATVLATESLAIAADPYAHETIYESYPFEEGVCQLLEANPQAQVAYLETCRAPKRTAAMINALLAEDCMAPHECCHGKPQIAPQRHVAPSEGAAEGSFETLTLNTAADELACIANHVQMTLGAGVQPWDVCITYTDHRWGKRIVRELASRRIRVTTAMDDSILKGDVTDVSKCGAARMMALLNLLANPKSALAWRAICGFGDPLTESPGFRAVRAYAQSRGMSLPLAFMDLEQNPKHRSIPELASAASLLKKHDHVLSVVRSLANMRGQRLIDALAVVSMGLHGEEIPAGFLDLIGRVGEDDSAEEMFARALRNATLGGLSGQAAMDCVRVLPVDCLTGQTPKLLIFSGFMNGFIPQREYLDVMGSLEEDIARVWNHDTHTMYRVVSKAAESFEATSFARSSVEEAEKYRLFVNRIKVERGARVAVLSPSVYAEILG